jgi:hypothetical protein
MNLADIIQGKEKTMDKNIMASEFADIEYFGGGRKFSLRLHRAFYREIIILLIGRGFSGIAEIL